MDILASKNVGQFILQVFPAMLLKFTRKTEVFLNTETGKNTFIIQISKQIKTPPPHPTKNKTLPHPHPHIKTQQSTRWKCSKLFVSTTQVPTKCQNSYFTYIPASAECTNYPFTSMICLFTTKTKLCEMKGIQESLTDDQVHHGVEELPTNDQVHHGVEESPTNDQVHHARSIFFFLPMIRSIMM